MSRKPTNYRPTTRTNYRQTTGNASLNASTGMSRKPTNYRPTTRTNYRPTTENSRLTNPPVEENPEELHDPLILEPPNNNNAPSKRPWQLSIPWGFGVKPVLKAMSGRTVPVFQAFSSGGMALRDGTMTAMRYTVREVGRRPNRLAQLSRVGAQTATVLGYTQAAWLIYDIATNEHVQSFAQEAVSQLSKFGENASQYVKEKLA